MHKILQETLNSADFELEVGLWFSESGFGMEQIDTLECVSSRNLKLEFLSSKIKQNRERPFLIMETSIKIQLNCTLNLGSFFYLILAFSGQGIHYCVPVLFDYFHLAAVSITVHGVLVSIHQPYLSSPRQVIQYVVYSRQVIQ